LGKGAARKSRAFFLFVPAKNFTDAAILFGDQFFGRPILFDAAEIARLEMQPFGEGFGETVGQTLHKIYCINGCDAAVKSRRFTYHNIFLDQNSRTDAGAR